jgi:CBS domain containing-hemolysin-like protein
VTLTATQLHIAQHMLPLLGDTSACREQVSASRHRLRLQLAFGVSSFAAHAWSYSDTAEESHGKTVAYVQVFVGCAGALVVMTILSTGFGAVAPKLVRLSHAYSVGCPWQFH